MNLFRTINKLSRRRVFWMVSFAIILVLNGLILVTYVSNNRNELVFNPYIKSGLPLYRGVREIANAAINSTYIFKMKRDVGIPQYRLEISASDLRKLNEKLPSSLSNDVIAGNFLFGGELKEYTIPGTFYYDDKEYDVEVRNRGTNANHWTRPKKSWQVKFKKDTLFNGIRTLKLIIPSDRAYLAEDFNNYRAKKLGLVLPDAEFSQLYINNDYQGVYFAIEDFSKEFLEKNEKPSDANLYVTREFLNAASRMDSVTVYDDIDFWRKETEDDLFNFDNFSELDFLLDLMEQDDFSKNAEDIIDMESFYSWNVVALLAGSNHQSNWADMRLYFNNTKGKFEFIPWDVGIRSYLPSQLTNDLTQKILDNPEFYLTRNQKLWDYVNNVENLEEDLAYYDGMCDNLKGAFYSDFKKHDNNITFNRKVTDTRNQYIMLFNRLRGLYDEDEVNFVIKHDASKLLLTLSFEINSLAGLTIDTVELPSGSVVVSKSGQYLFKPNQVVEIKYEGNTIEDISEIKIKFSNAITGEKVKADSTQFSDVSTFSTFSDISATIDEFVGKYPVFQKLDNDVVLRSGIYTFSRDIIIPKNTTLYINPGTTVYLAPEVSFVSYSPVEARGISARPIVFRRLNATEPWGSFAILNNKSNKSTIEYFNIDGGSSDYVNGVFLSGMMSVYNSDVHLSNISATSSGSDDGVNLKYSNVTVENSTFHNNSADGLDLDFVRGTVSGNRFTSNGNDGIDVSGSSIVINNNHIQGSGDKCISIGENTIDTFIVSTTMDRCAIGLEVKDNSDILVQGSTITNNTNGINAYMKKPIFKSGGVVNVYNTVIENNETQTQTDELSQIIDHGNETVELE